MHNIKTYATILHVNNQIKICRNNYKPELDIRAACFAQPVGFGKRTVRLVSEGGEGGEVASRDLTPKAKEDMAR
ncbi:MAG: hypothetical protein ABI354_00145 [Candidatus Saccharimonadales bacterium]